MSSVLGKKIQLQQTNLSNTDVLGKHFEVLGVLMMVKMLDLVCEIAERKYYIG